MPQSQITTVIAGNGLRPGDAMVDVHGAPIAGSVVLDAHTFVHPRTECTGGWELQRERVIHGDEVSFFLSDRAMRALQKVDVA